MSNPMAITFKETKKERKKEVMNNRIRLETIISLLFMKMCYGVYGKGSFSKFADS